MHHKILTEATSSTKRPNLMSPSSSEDKDSSPLTTHPNTSSRTTTNASGSSYPVRRRLEAMVEGLSSPSKFESTSNSQSPSQPETDSLPPIRTVAPDSLGPRAKNKVVIVTGANSILGIGRAAAHQFARHGAKAVYICDFDDSELVAHKKEMNTLYPSTQVHPVQIDVSDEAAVKALCDDAITRYGRLDIMFANAGIVGSPTTFEHIEADDYMRVMKVNALGVFLCFKYAALAMKKTSPSKPVSSGSLIGTASVAGLRSNAGSTDYSASKAAVISMAQTFAYQLVGTGIRANAVCPGLTETGMTGVVFEMARQRGTEKKIGQLNPTRRGAIADEVARVALFLGSDESSYVNGQAWSVCGGLSAGHPFVPGKLA